jgi:beta-lactamase class A
MSFTRRTVLFGSLFVPALARAQAATLAAVERRYGGRLGVSVLDTGSGRSLGHRADERFALCSTFKLLAVACVLERVDSGRERLDRPIAVPPKERLVAYSPATSQHAGGAMPLAAICEAAMTLSDNTAANLILDSIGGPPAVTAYARALGDTVTRLDRDEPTLNDVKPGDPRDTTSPAAMAANLRRIVLGDVLSEASRSQLVAWLVANKTGGDRLRAGLPKSWRVGDKTGSGSGGIGNDIAVAWPPGRAPLIIAAYYAGGASNAPRDAVLAQVGRIAAAI